MTFKDGQKVVWAKGSTSMTFTYVEGDWVDPFGILFSQDVLISQGWAIKEDTNEKEP